MRTLLLAIALTSLCASLEASSTQFRRGDANLDGAVNIGDAILALDFLFSGSTSECWDALDVNDDGAVDVGDPISLLSFLFSAGPAPSAPFPDCGFDPTPDALFCRVPSAPSCDAPSPHDPQDYSTWYWPTNHRPTETWPATETVSHFVTGHYAFAWDEETGAMPHFGALQDDLDVAEAQDRPLDDVESLPAASLTFSVGTGASAIDATELSGVNPGSPDRMRMVDGGHFMNRFELTTITYADDPAVVAAGQVAAMPRHVVFSQTVAGSAQTDTASLRFSGDALDLFDTPQWLVSDKAITLTDASGEGWLFVAYDTPGASTTLQYDAVSGVTATRVSFGSPQDGVTVSLLAAPLSALGDRELQLYLDPENTISVGYTLLDLTGAEAAPEVSSPWDPTLGAYVMPLQGLQAAGSQTAPTYDITPSSHNEYSRHRLTVDAGTAGPVAVPLAMHSHVTVTWSMTSGVPMFRDENGEPTGLPIQVSKNWHEGYWDNWYHFYSQPTLVGDGPESWELTVASSRWGDVYAASHAQLSLIGWGEAGGHWQQSALGAFGESITYDPDKNLGRALVDDVRPFLVESGSRWDWTGNVGGADFLVYSTAAQPWWVRRLQRVRSHVRSPGPNLTEVRWTGVSSDDGSIAADIRIRMGATDDLVRAWYELDYTFLQDVAYDRLAFFQVAADDYSDNGFSRYAWGDASGVLQDLPTPTSATPGYASDADRGIPLSGPSPWVMLYDNELVASLSEQEGDVGFIVRKFNANIGGVELTTPHINLRRTNNWGAYPQMSFELGLPHEAGSPWCGLPCGGETRFIPAGSTVHAVVEYVVPPSDKLTYYGDSEQLLALPDATFGSPDMMVALAGGNDLVVDVSVGELLSTWPVEVAASPDAIAAELQLTGGFGRVPLTVSGLLRHDGWVLQQQVAATWVDVDHDIHGNDSWQASYDAASHTWALTWSLPNTGTITYRLHWQP